MPLDNTGAPAPSSRHAERLARLKLLRRKAGAEQRKRRRWLKNQLLVANILLAEIIDGADLIGEVTIIDEMDGPNLRYRIPGVCLLVTLEARRFQQLCEHGAEIEDLEDTNDAEPTPGCEEGELDHSDDELSVGAGAPECNGYGRSQKDLEIIAAARERYNPHLTYPSVDPELRRAGSWTMERRPRR